MPSSAPQRCAVCAETEDLVGVVIAGRPVLLCTLHHDKLETEGPQRFGDLATFFADPEFDRRGRPDRRKRARRQFPPRPEGRRHNRGRRADDPQG